MDRRSKNINTSNEMTGRIAIVDTSKCMPTKCNHQCSRYCPVNMTGKVCVTANREIKKAEISEVLCIGCGSCVKMCPFEAIRIINLPQGIPNQCVHRFGKNGFKLYWLPEPILGKVLGIVGSNGIGKTTALQILTSRLQPNLGNYDIQPSWTDIIKHFNISSLNDYFKLVLDDVKPASKIQYVDQIPKVVLGTVESIVNKKDQRGKACELYGILELSNSKNKQISILSGGELQRFCIMITLLQNSRAYIFDEPTCYLDIKQRVIVSKCIQNMAKFEDRDNYVIVVDHDLSILDYVSDSICILYGEPSAYGVVVPPLAAGTAINHYLSGYLESVNMSIRSEKISFETESNRSDLNNAKDKKIYEYPSLKKKIGDFELEVEGGQFCSPEVIVLLGENATGKTTFLNIIAGIDKQFKTIMPALKISYKPQTISPNFDGTVKEFTESKLMHVCQADRDYKKFIFDVCDVRKFATKYVKDLSGGEMQRLALAIAFSKSADVLILDEPSAYLDCEMRLMLAKNMRRYLYDSKKTAFIVEHDFIMATYLADKVMVFEGTPGISCKASRPLSVVDGMNRFLSIMQISFRKDPASARPRINKLNSLLDKNQKVAGNYFSMV